MTSGSPPRWRRARARCSSSSVATPTRPTGRWPAADGAGDLRKAGDAGAQAWLAAALADGPTRRRGPVRGGRRRPSPPDSRIASGSSTRSTGRASSASASRTAAGATTSRSTSRSGARDAGLAGGAVALPACGVTYSSGAPVAPTPRPPPSSTAAVPSGSPCRARGRPRSPGRWPSATASSWCRWARPAPRSRASSTGPSTRTCTPAASTSGTRRPRWRSRTRRGVRRHAPRRLAARLQPARPLVAGPRRLPPGARGAPARAARRGRRRRRRTARDARTRSSQLRTLEAESIHIFREVAAEMQRPCLLFSGGKDSIVMLHVARKAFAPARIPFPVMHVDTGLNFDSSPRLPRPVDREARPAAGRRLGRRTRSSAASSRRSPTARATGSRRRCCSRPPRRTASTRCSAAARRDEEKARAKERVFSFRDEFGQWDPKNQRPEIWNLYNGRVFPGQSIRVFPLSNWTELDIWTYIAEEAIEIPDLYLAARPRGRRARRDAVRGQRRSSRPATARRRRSLRVRYRTVGDANLTAAVESDADTRREDRGRDRAPSGSPSAAPPAATTRSARRRWKTARKRATSDGRRAAPVRDGRAPSTTARARSSAACCTTPSRCSATSSRRSSGSAATAATTTPTSRCSPTACAPSASRASRSTSPTATSRPRGGSSSSPTPPGTSSTRATWSPAPRPPTSR